MSTVEFFNNKGRKSIFVFPETKCIHESSQFCGDMANFLEYEFLPYMSSHLISESHFIFNDQVYKIKEIAANSYQVEFSSKKPNDVFLEHSQLTGYTPRLL